MESNTLIAADWKYKAEGNKHVVLFNSSGQVLRMKKSSDPMNQEHTNSLISQQQFYKDHLDFLTYVIRPLLQNSSLCEIPSEINLPLEFITNIGNLIEKERPSFRRNKSLHSHQPALLMSDSSFIKSHPTFLDCEMELSSTVFCVELKTKKGFMSNIDPVFNKSVCQFCSTQVYRTSNSFNNRNTRASYYCPIDLFSGNHSFMRRALEALVEVPSNNLRVFKNGQLVYSQEILDEIELSGIHDCETFLKTLLTFPIENNSTDLEMCFYDVLIQTLLLPITDHASSAQPKHVRFCHSSYYKQKSTGAYSKKYGLIQYSRHLDTAHESMLPSSCILGIVLSAQKISCNDSAQNILDSYQRVTTNTYSNTSKQMVLIDAPYTTCEWKRIGNYTSQAFNESTNIKQTR